MRPHPQVEVAYEYRVKISQICSDLNVDGIRGDIVTNRAAKALAAFEGRKEVRRPSLAVCGVSPAQGPGAFAPTPAHILPTPWLRFYVPHRLHRRTFTVSSRSASGTAFGKTRWPRLTTATACGRCSRRCLAWSDLASRCVGAKRGRGCSLR